MPAFHLLTSISELSGVGSKRKSILNDHGISTLQDLLYYFPRRHLDRTSITPIRKLEKGMVATLIGQVETFGEKSVRRGKLFQVILSDGTGILTLTWFNGVRFMKKLFKVGDRLAIHGKIDWYNGPSITHPEFDKINPDDDPISTGAVVPLYPLTNELGSIGVDQRVLRKMVRELLRSGLAIPELFPNPVILEYKLISRKNGLEQIHFADNVVKLNNARRRLKFDEHFFLQLLMALRKQKVQTSGTKPLPDIGPYFRTISDTLDFELTGAQKKVIKEIHSDLKRSFPMNRLIQGDVGCGKTIVAILVSALAVGNNVQVAIMAPTEILASQHYHSFKGKLEKVNIPCTLLVGKMKKSDRGPILSGLKNGNIPVVIGTHALIQDDLMFKNLRLVIVDEQHRFGVNQRSALLEKGYHPHFMAMTATPIPRTLSITYHGDMDLSIIDEMPANRIPVITKVVEPERLNKIYTFIKQEVAAGRQCMVVYPLVEESEKSDLAAAVEAHKELDDKRFPDLNVGLIHGRMNTDEKENTINKFVRNEIKILISTTVIEVGVDIPNASVMLVEHAERFGLTQLHQLRGRVGRGAEKSYCILVKRNITDTSRTRLSIMEKTNDGFLIADEDLKLRGPGEYFGVKQSGFFQYKIANMATDRAIIQKARKAAFKLIDNDPALQDRSNKSLRQTFLKAYAHRLDDINLS